MNLLSQSLILALVVAVTCSDAHIKLFYSPWQLPIRNAPSSTSDGVFSAAANQPCGGAQVWGREQRNRYGSVVDGQKVCARVNWNGGHRTTVNENKLRASFLCGQPDNAQQLLQAPRVALAEGTSPSPESEFIVNANRVNEEYDGYTVCVNLPFQNIVGTNLGDSARRCTLSITEGNSWGGCLDLLLFPTAANGGVLPEATPAPLMSAAEYAAVVDKPLSLQNSEGTYQIVGCNTDTGGKCCLTGFFGVRNNGAVSARFFGNSGPETCFDTSISSRDYQMILRPSKFSKDLFETTFLVYMGYDVFGRPVTTQNMSISFKDGGTISLSNVGLDIPEISDHDVVPYSSLENGLNLGLIPYPNYSTSADNTNYGLVVGCIIGGIILIYLVGGVVFSRATGGPYHHPHIHAVLVGLGLVKRKRKNNMVNVGEEDIEKPTMGSNPVAPPPRSKTGFSLALPPHWCSAVDQMSGEVYYYNVQTKETKWERPTV